MKILIPPSEGKANIKPINILFKDTDFIFKEQVKNIINTLGKLSDKDVLKTYGTTYEKSIYLNNLNTNAFNNKCIQSIYRYTGVVYKHLSYKTLDHNSKKYMNNNFLIFSGLFGLLSPLSLIPDYKLKMSALKLYNYWNPFITETLKQEDLIIDLLPQLHRKSYLRMTNTVYIDFMIMKDGEKKAAGHLGKTVKGKFIRYICENKISKISDFKDFEYDGFHWDGISIVKN